MYSTEVHTYSNETGFLQKGAELHTIAQRIISLAVEVIVRCILDCKGAWHVRT